MASKKTPTEAERNAQLTNDEQAQRDQELEAKARDKDLPQTLTDDSRHDSETDDKPENASTERLSDADRKRLIDPHYVDAGDTPIEHRGGPGSASGRAIQESSDRVRAEEMGVTGTRESTLSGLQGAAPIVDHEEAAEDERRRQRADDERRRAARKVEAEYQEKMEELHRAASPQFDKDGNPLYNDLGQPLNSDGDVIEERPEEADDKRKRL